MGGDKWCSILQQQVCVDLWSFTSLNSVKKKKIEFLRYYSCAQGCRKTIPGIMRLLFGNWYWMSASKVALLHWIFTFQMTTHCLFSFIFFKLLIQGFPQAHLPTFMFGPWPVSNYTGKQCAFGPWAIVFEFSIAIHGPQG